MLTLVSSKVSIGSAAGATAARRPESKSCHCSPENSGLAASSGSASGLPQAQRTRGMPRSSTITAVPACRTAWKGLATVPVKPWLVTRVSSRRMTGVSEAT